MRWCCWGGGGFRRAVVRLCVGTRTHRRGCAFRLPSTCTSKPPPRATPYPLLLVCTLSVYSTRQRAKRATQESRAHAQCAPQGPSKWGPLIDAPSQQHNRVPRAPRAQGGSTQQAVAAAPTHQPTGATAAWPMGTGTLHPPASYGEGCLATAASPLQPTLAGAGRGLPTGRHVHPGVQAEATRRHVRYTAPLPNRGTSASVSTRGRPVTLAATRLRNAVSPSCWDPWAAPAGAAYGVPSLRWVRDASEVVPLW